MNNFKISPNTVVDSELKLALIKGGKLTIDEVDDIVAYNVITPLQLAEITRKDTSTIHNILRQAKQNPDGTFDAYLTKVFPFKFRENMGPTFIAFDEKCKKLIIKSLESHGRTDGSAKKEGQSQ